jgi:cell division protein FtsB
MYRQKSQSKFVSFFFSRGFFLLALLLVFLMGLAFLQENKRQGKINQRIAELRAEAQKIEASNFELGRLLSYTGSEEYTELQARQALNYKKEGEGVIIINRETGDQGLETRDARSNWQKWVNYIFTRE